MGLQTFKCWKATSKTTADNYLRPCKNPFNTSGIDKSPVIKFQIIYFKGLTKEIFHKIM